MPTTSQLIQEQRSLQNQARWAARLEQQAVNWAQRQADMEAERQARQERRRAEAEN